MTNMLRSVLASSILTLGGAQASGYDDMSASDIRDLGRRAAQWQFANVENPPSYGRYVLWLTYPRDWVWGAALAGLTEFATQSNSPDLLNEVRGFADNVGWRPGDKPRFADDWCIIWSYAELHAFDREPKQLAASVSLFDDIMQESWDESLEWRNSIHHRELAWCDSLFMGPPTLTRLTRVTGDDRYREFGDRLWWKTTDYLYDEEHGFYYRDSRFFDQTEENGKPVFWARGNGWVYGGITRMIEDLPVDHPSTPRYIQLFREMSRAIIDAQKPDGFWPAGLLDPERWDKPESSGTAFFTYGLAWGLNHGLLDSESARRAAHHGWNALVSVTDPDGRLRAIQPIGDDPYDFDPASTMPYGMGALLLAASEMYKMALLKETPSVAFHAENPMNEVRLLETIEMPWTDLPAEFRRRHPAGDVVVLDVRGGDLLLTQTVDEDGDGDRDTLLFQATMGPRERRAFRLHAISEEDARDRSGSLVFARPVPERKDDFAWESDRAVYRMYGPALRAEGARAGVDVWSKRVRTPVIDEFYATGDYHTDQGKGLDGYSVGPTAGGGGVVLVADGYTARCTCRRSTTPGGSSQAGPSASSSSLGTTTGLPVTAASPTAPGCRSIAGRRSALFRLT